MSAEPSTDEISYRGTDFRAPDVRARDGATRGGDHNGDPNGDPNGAEAVRTRVDRAWHPMRLAAFNELDDTAAFDAVNACLPIGRWCAALVRARPFKVVDDLFEAARDAAHPFTETEVVAAAGRLAQAGPGPAGEPSYLVEVRALEQSLADAARQYRAKFGRPCVIRSAGRTDRDLLAQLRDRLVHEPATEVRSTAHELRQIGLLALADLIRG